MTTRLPHTGPWQPARRLAAGLLALGCSWACAADTETDTEGGADIHFSGFGTLGVVHGNAPAGWGFRRDSTQPANSGGTRADVDSRLGLQASYRTSAQVEFVAQALLANRPSSAPVRDALTLAFAAWRPTDEITLRGGRLSTDYFLLPEYRNVGFAYPFVRPPVESYGPVPSTVDGADLTRAWHVDSTVWKLRAIAGRSTVPSDGLRGSLSLQPVYAVVASRDDGDGLLVKASAARTRLRVDTTGLLPLIDALRMISALPVPGVAAEASALAAGLASAGRPVTYTSLGAGLDRGGWMWSIELSHARPEGSKSSTQLWGLLGRRWGAFTGYAVASDTHGPGPGSPPQWTAALAPLIGGQGAAGVQQLGEAAFNASAAAAAAGQHSTALGLRWDFSDRMALKLQWDRIHVRAYGGQLWSSRTNDAIRANVGSATFDFVF